MLKSILVSSLILFSTVIIESSILSNITFLIVIPDLVLICSLYFSLLNGKTYGEITGFISGLFLDFFTGVPLGFNCLYRTLIGYLYGLFSKNIILSGIFIPMLSVGIGTILKRILIFVISLLFPNTNLYVYGFITFEFLFEMLANIILAPIIFKFLSFFSRTLSLYDEKDMIDNV
ncbi:MAG: rod shape-determining protein MreD [Treponema sp.]|nr:rod shape-determining protein MreD [Treponema sp.]